MSEIGTSIIEGLQEAVAYMDGSADKATYRKTEYTPLPAPAAVDVKAIRQRLGLSQAVFSSAFGLSLHAVRNWEQGKRMPDPAARAYLKVISQEPELVRRALMA